MKKKNKKYAYIQNWGTYSNQTAVCVGMSRQEIVNYLRRIKSPAEMAVRFLERTADFDKHIRNNSDTISKVFYDEGRSILSFADWKNDWQHWDYLVHEITHLVHNILGHYKNMMDEDEARAYQTEFLFIEIRRKLWKLSEK